MPCDTDRRRDRRGRADLRLHVPRISDRRACRLRPLADLTWRFLDPPAATLDRYHLQAFPVLLGEGKSLFDRSGQKEKSLSLRSSESYPNGVVKLVYVVMR